MSVLLIGTLTGCRPADPPQVVFQRAYTDYVHGDLDVARTQAEQARKKLSADTAAAATAWALKFRFLEAEVLLRQNRPADALALLTDRAVSIAPRGDAAIKWNLLCGLAHSRVGEHEASGRELQLARQLAEPTHSSLLAEVLRVEGLIARDSDQIELALDKLKSSIAAIRPGSDLMVKAADLVDVGYINLLRNHFTEAVYWSQRAVDFARSLQARRQLQFALGNLGWANMNLGDFEGGLAHFQEAEQHARKLGLTQVRALWLLDAGLAAYRVRNLQQAQEYDEQALQLASQAQPRDEEAVAQIANIQTNLALLLYEREQYAAAKRHSDAAVAVAKHSKDDNVIAYGRFLQGLLASHLSTDQDAEALLTSAWQLARDVDFKAQIENALANLYSHEQRLDQAQIWYQRAIQTFEDKRASVKDEAMRLSTFSYGATVYRDYAAFLIEAKRPMEALRVLDRSRARTLDDGLTPTGAQPRIQDKSVADPAVIARKLGASILFYSLGPQKSYLWAVTPSRTQLFELPGEAEIRALLATQQTDIQQSADLLRNADSAAVRLYDILIEPAAALIPSGSRVFIIPDGALHGLNFETLAAPSGAGRQYWIEDVTVTTASSIRMLAALEVHTAPRTPLKDLLLIGDPRPPQGDFAPLPGAAAEIQQVRGHFPMDSQTVIAQVQATPESYAASQPEQFRYIHFTAHGTASRLSPLDSAIVLSPPPQDPEDFKLYARDIVQHPLNATLVTISACYGSGVRTYAGEGLVGLAWVFLRAGSHNVIAALWQVADATSPLLMGRLYDELQAGKAPDAALHVAKLSVIHSSGIYRKPLFWGAFQLYAGS